MKIIQFVFPLVILNLIALILVTFGLPDIVPIHINLVGAVDGFGSRWYIPIIGMMPVFIVVIYILYTYYLQSDLNKNIEDKIIPAIAIIVIPISWIPTILALNYFHLIEIIVFISIIIAILFIFISYYIENLKINKYTGIRTPWTLKNEVIWKKTHKLGSYTFMIGGFVLIVYGLATFISKNLFYFTIGLTISIILVAAVPTIYSYYEYNKFKDH